MSKSILKSVSAGENKARDTRNHEERLSALWLVFGELKAVAKRTGKVNDCSTNKICKKASVNKTYLTGIREFKDSDVTDKYQAVNKAIQQWREDFKKDAELTEEQELINKLATENKNLKGSIKPLEIKLLTLEVAMESMPEELKQANDTITILQSSLLKEKSTKQNNSKMQNFGIASPVTRRIVSPDKYRIKDGVYVLGTNEDKQKVTHKATKELEDILSRELPQRLYILVGMPCSGKTTWAETANLNSDKHPVIYDATNLTKTERTEIVFQLRHFDDIEICCVVFDTKMTTIRKRNINNRTADKQIPDKILDAMYSKYIKPDPYIEKWIDELIVVRA